MNRYHWLRLLAPVMGRFPAASYPIAAAAGWLTWHLQPRMRRTLLRNVLPFCDGDRARARSEGRRALRNIGRYWVDVASIPHRDMANFERDHIRLVNGERLDVLKDPGPVLVVSAHTGNPELCLQAITFRGRQFTALVENIQPPAMGRYLLNLRSSAGGRFEVASIGGVRAVLEALRAGEVAGIVADRDIQGTGVCVQLAGRPVKIARGPWELARRTGATVLPVFATRDWRDGFTVRVEEPFKVDCIAPLEEAVRDAAEHFAGLLEAHLRREPGQWTVSEDFWSVHRCAKG